jgi:hypothetical protein
MRRLLKAKVVIPGRPIESPAPPPEIKRRADGMFFYQACDLPDLGFVPGAWDHRGSEDVYLAHTDFDGMTAIDVGPANGFWSFAMEKRGAQVTAIELGHNDRWDEVPHAIDGQAGLTEALHSSVEAVHADFLKCHSALASKVQIKRGNAYATPDLIKSTDIALMGNILQHLRDPFLAIERVAKVVRKRIIISESSWIDDEAFLHSSRISLIPRHDLKKVNHSWYQVTPGFVGEVLGILGFVNLNYEMHWQKFYVTDPSSTPQMVRHFTFSGDRPAPTICALS